jgi:hypothetical protein
MGILEFFGVYGGGFPAGCDFDVAWSFSGPFRSVLAWADFPTTTDNFTGESSQPDIHLMTGSCGMLAAKEALVVPMLLRHYHFRLCSYAPSLFPRKRASPWSSRPTHFKILVSTARSTQ